MKRFALAAAVVALASCGPQPLSLWRVTIDGIEADAACYGPLGATTVVTSEGVHNDSGVWELYEGADEKFYLGSTMQAEDGEDVYPITFEGTYADGKYTFEGTLTTAEKESDSTTFTITEKYALTLEIDGDAFTGEIKQDRTSSCTGNCPEDIKEYYPDCKVKGVVHGTRIEAVKKYIPGSIGKEVEPR